MDNKNGAFRRDVDVLRGVAVVLVVLYHLEIKTFQSGFIGVDIFFVLSGYLIGSIYSRHQSITDFYERRLRRILPAMLVTLFFSFLLSPLFFLPFEVEKMVDSVIGALLFVPNVIFWRDNDYFSNLDFSPLLHYWSLGVELQYYVIFPALFFIFKKNRFFLPAFALGSLIICIALTEISAKSAFFLLPTRLWEFFFGYLAYQVRDAKIVIQIRESRYSTICALSFLLALFVLSVLPMPSGKFPGFYAFFPVLFSFLYIVVGLENKKVIESGLFVAICWIAKISFSIYLIHFPVIFIFKYGPFSQWNEITSVEAAACVLITLVLAFLSFRYVENPFRNEKRISLRQFMMFVAMAYLLIISTIIIFRAYSYFNHTYTTEKVGVFNAMTDRGAWRCSKLQKLKEPGADSCYLFKAENPRKIIYLVGDSHIDALKEAFTDIAMEENISVRLNRERCLLGVSQCSAAHVIKEIKTYDVTDVVMHGYQYAQFNYTDLKVLVDWLKENNINFHIIGPIPEYDVSIPAALYKEIISSSNLINKQNLGSFIQSIPREYLQFLESVAGYKNVFSYRPELIFCVEECMLASEKGVYYFDSNHLTITGAKELRPIILDIYSK
jgi:peptidoglycan/LPS O-acetylase OafA/YrhL